MGMHAESFPGSMRCWPHWEKDWMTANNDCTGVLSRSLGLLLRLVCRTSGCFGYFRVVLKMGSLQKWVRSNLILWYASIEGAHNNNTSLILFVYVSLLEYTLATLTSGPLQWVDLSLVTLPSHRCPHTGTTPLCAPTTFALSHNLISVGTAPVYFINYSLYIISTLFTPALYIPPRESSSTDSQETRRHPRAPKVAGFSRPLSIGT